MTISSASSQVLSDAGDLTGAYATAEALVDSASRSGTDDLELVTARMIASREEFSDRSLGLFSKIVKRCGPAHTVELAYEETMYNMYVYWKI